MSGPPDVSTWRDLCAEHGVDPDLDPPDVRQALSRRIVADGWRLWLPEGRGGQGPQSGGTRWRRVEGAAPGGYTRERHAS